MVNRLTFAKARSVRTGKKISLQQVKISGTSAGWHRWGRVLCSALRQSAAPCPLAHSILTTLPPCYSSNLPSTCPTQDFALAVRSTWNALPLVTPPQRWLPHLCQSPFHQASAEKPPSQRGLLTSHRYPPLSLCLPCYVLLLHIYCFPNLYLQPLLLERRLERAGLSLCSSLQSLEHRGVGWNRERFGGGMVELRWGGRSGAVREWTQFTFYTLAGRCRVVGSGSGCKWDYQLSTWVSTTEETRWRLGPGRKSGGCQRYGLM